jgi:integrase/recombinase XerD
LACQGKNAEPEETIMSKETKSISELVNAISEEMTRLDYKPTVLKQYHVVWNKLCKRAGVRPANDFDMEFGMKFLGKACVPIRSI